MNRFQPSFDGRRSHACSDVRYEVPDNDAQFELLSRAVRRDLRETHRRPFGTRRSKIDEALVSKALGPFTEARSSELYELNPWAGQHWGDLLLGGLREARAPEPGFVTIINDRWGITQLLRMPGHGPEQQRLIMSATLKSVSDTSVGYVRSRLRDFEFIFQMEFAVLRIAGQDILAPHFHGLVWGDQERLRRVLLRLEPGHGGAPGGDRRAIHNLAGAVRYMAKDDRMVSVSQPNLGFQYGRYRDASGNYHFGERHSLAKRTQLLRLLGQKTKPELAISSGLGRDVLTSAKDIAEFCGWRRR